MSDRKPNTQADAEYVICPWCKTKSGDCWEWVRNHPSDMKCDNCGGTFKYWAEYSATYYAEPDKAPVIAEPPADE